MLFTRLKSENEYEAAPTCIDELFEAKPSTVEEDELELLSRMIK
jgi:hypothetical protein